MEINFVTGNKNKFKEVKAIMKGVDLHQVDIDIDEIQSAELEDIALAKARTAYETCQKPVVIEDTGFYLEALGGLPGPFIKYAEQALGSAAMLELLGERENRKGYARVLAVYYDGIKSVVGEGIIHGKITTTAREGEGFGFDCCFIPEGYNQTYSEMGSEEKIQISHRTKAFKDLLSKLPIE